jgi:hypothetical protein
MVAGTLIGHRLLGLGSVCQRRLNLDPLATVENGPPRGLLISLVVGLAGGGDAAEVAVLESVASPLSDTTSAWWTSLSIMAAATTSSPKTSPHRPKGLLLVTISEACS